MADAGGINTHENANRASGAEKEMNMENVKNPSARLLRVILAGLDEIRDHFVWEGLACLDDAVTEEPVSSYEPIEETDEASLYEEPFETSGFDREDVEIAIDDFLSRLFRAGMIRRDHSGALPLFSEVIEQFFGEDHQSAKAAKRFEEHIEGYFGRIDYESMKAAFDEFSEIREFVGKELEASKLAEPKGLFE